jgi:GxxExxY protein
LVLKNEELTAKIIRVYYDVYNELGHGFLEAVYEHAMTTALRDAGLKAEAQAPIPVTFRGHVVGEYRADILVEDKVLVELKAVRALAAEHYAQVIHYLRATPIEVGLLFNFGSRPSFKRFLFDNLSKKIRVNPCESVAKWDMQ